MFKFYHWPQRLSTFFPWSDRLTSFFFEQLFVESLHLNNDNLSIILSSKNDIPLKKKKKRETEICWSHNRSHELFFSAARLCILVHWGAWSVLLIFLLRMFKGKALKGQDLIKSLICTAAAMENTRSTNSLMSSPRFLPRCWHHCSHISGEMSAQWKKQKKKNVFVSFLK